MAGPEFDNSSNKFCFFRREIEGQLYLPAQKIRIFFFHDQSVLFNGIVFMVQGQRATLLEEKIMSTTIAVTKEVTTLINILTVEPENQSKLLALLRDSTESVVSRLDGWISTSFIAATDQRHVVIYSQWRDLASVDAMRSNPAMVAYFPRVAALAAFDSLAGDVVYNHHA